MIRSYKEGMVVGTGALIEFNLGFVPTRVEIELQDGGGWWDEDLIDGGFAFKRMGTIVAGNIVLGVPTLARGTTSDLALRAYAAIGRYVAAATTDVAHAAAETAFTATTHDVTANKWASFLLSIVTGGTRTITMSAAANYSSEAIAIAALPALPALNAPLGYITIQAQPGALWDASSHSLAGGATSPAAQTNYYRCGGILSGGISRKGIALTDTYKGFTLGTNGNLNVLGTRVYWRAYRY